MQIVFRQLCTEKISRDQTHLSPSERWTPYSLSTASAARVVRTSVGTVCESFQVLSIPLANKSRFSLAVGIADHITPVYSKRNISAHEKKWFCQTSIDGLSYDAHPAMDRETATWKSSHKTVAHRTAGAPDAASVASNFRAT